MKSKRRIVACIVVVLVTALVFLLLFPMLYSPSLNFDEEGLKKKCGDFMSRTLSVTNLVETAQEAADILRQFDDPWGHKFNVVVADKFATASFGRASGCLIMWSSGPNGVNENGQGDDIIAEGELALPDGINKVLEVSK